MNAGILKLLKNLLRRIIMFLLIFLGIMAGTKNNYKSEYILPIRARSIFPSDINLDGNMDVVVGHNSILPDTNPSISLLSNNGNGQFVITDTSLVFCGYQEDILVDIINPDTFPDLVTFYISVNGNSGQYLRIIYNENGTFTQYIDYLISNTFTVNCKTLGDVDNDNDIDIIIASNSGQNWGILYNDGTGQLTSPEYHNVSGYWPTDLECGNLNNDNRNDILLTGAKTEIYFSYPSGFQNIVVDNLANHEVEIADMDNDGDNDIVAIRCWGSTYLFIYENLGNGSFIKHTAGVFNEFYSYYLEIGDLNNDTLPDAICSDDYGIHILFNKNDFIFGEHEFYPVSYSSITGSYSVCADFNNDNWIDIANVLHASGFYYSLLTLFFNDGTGHFIPNPPTSVLENMEISKPELKVYPNPSRSFGTTISFTLDKKQSVELHIMDLNGKTIKTLKNNLLEKGNHKYKWNGHDNNGLKCLPGVYMVLFKTNDKSESVKLLKK